MMEKKRNILPDNQEASDSEAYAQLMLDSIPAVSSVWGEDGRMIDCNMEALRWFGLPRKSEYMDHFYKMMPEFQPDGSRSVEKQRELITRAFQTGFLRFEWEYLTLQNEIIPALVVLVRVPWKGGYRVLSYSNDLREIRKANKDIDRRNKLLQIVNIIAANLMTFGTEGFDSVIVKQLGVLGSAIGADNVSLWENHTLDGEEYAQKKHEWPLDSRRLGNSLGGNTVSYKTHPYLKERMLSGKSINMTTRQLPEEERRTLGSSLVKSVLAVPIYQDDSPWGFIGLESVDSDSAYYDIDEKVLRLCGFLIASAVVRNRMIRHLLEAQNELTIQGKLLRAINEVATSLLAKGKQSRLELTRSCLGILGESVAASLVSLWRVCEQGEEPYISNYLDWRRDEEMWAWKEKRIKLADYIPEWGRNTQNRFDIDLPTHRMNANMQGLSFLRSSESLLLMPIDMEGSFWGFIGFSYPAGTRRLNSEERSILRAGSLNIVSAIVRNEIEEDSTA